MRMHSFTENNLGLFIVHIVPEWFSDESDFNPRTESQQEAILEASTDAAVTASPPVVSRFGAASKTNRFYKR